MGFLEDVIGKNVATIANTATELNPDLYMKKNGLEDEKPVLPTKFDPRDYKINPNNLVNRKQSARDRAISDIKASDTYYNLVKNNYDAYNNRELEDTRSLQRNVVDPMMSAPVNNTINAFNTDFVSGYNQTINDQTSNADNFTGTVASALNQRMKDKEGNRSFLPWEWDTSPAAMSKSAPEVNALYDYYNNLEKREKNSLEESGFSKRKHDWGDYISQNLIDDGDDPVSDQALMMTGERYIEYIMKYGLKGRPLKDIDPKKLYSKQDEAEYFGFQPYLTGDKEYQRYWDLAQLNFANNVFNNFANARRIMTDYDIDLGNGKIASGKDFDKNFAIWSSKASDNYKNTSSTLAFSENNPFDNQYAIPLTRSVYDTNNNFIGYIGNNARINQTSDGDYMVWIPNEDGSFSSSDQIIARGYQSEEDVYNHVVMSSAKPNEPVFAWQDIDPLVLDDGTVIRADQAIEIEKFKQNNGDYGYSTPIPNAMKGIDDFAAWFTDLATGSAALFNPYTAGLQASSNTLSYLGGLEPGNNYLDGSYTLVSDKPTEEQAISRAAGAALLPATENIWGSLGSKVGGEFLGNIWRKARHLPKLDESSRSWINRWARGTLGESMEEIPGNIVEGIMNNGLLDWYADPVYVDSNGNRVSNENEGQPLLDSQGHIVYDDETPWDRRLQNFIADIPEAMAGGAWLGGVLGLPRIKGYAEQNQAWRYRNNGLKANKLPLRDIMSETIDTSNIQRYSDEEKDRIRR